MPATSVSKPASIPPPADLKAAMASDTKIDVSSIFVADKAACESATATFVALTKKEDPAAVAASGFSDAAVKVLADKKSPAVREASANAVSAAIKQGAVKSLEPSFISTGLYAALVEAFADNMPAVRTAAVEAVEAYVAAMNPWATVFVLPALLHQIKTGALTVLNQIIVSAPE